MDFFLRRKSSSSGKVRPLINTYKGKGLFIGINYSGPNKLKGCIEDSDSLSSYFEGKGFSCDKLTSNQTRRNILSRLNSLSQDSIQGERNFVIQYSGHGSNSPDQNGDERDGRDEFLVSSDIALISDDELSSILRNFHPDSRILLIADACHSGSIFDLPYNYSTINCPDDAENEVQSIEESGFFKENKLPFEQKIIAISGCTDAQFSTDTYSNRRKKHCGALSNSLTGHGDFIELEIFNLKASVESEVYCYNQRPCVSSSFPLKKEMTMSSIFLV